MRLYLCGPVSLGGTCTPEQERAFIKHFHDVEEMLTSAGYIVESPVKAIHRMQFLCVGLPDDGNIPVEPAARWQWYMRRTVIQMLTCDGVATLDRASESRGAIKEMDIAMTFGLQVKPFGAWLRIANSEDLYGYADGRTGT